MTRKFQPLTQEDMPASITWCAPERIPVRFCMLVIRLDRVVDVAGSLSSLGIGLRLPGASNGRLWWIVDMMIPSDYLEGYVDEVLIPLGMQEGRDFVFLIEKYFRHLDNALAHLAGHPLPALADVDWLDSIIEADGQQYIWWKTPKDGDI
jgi:hypothetical protein